MKIKPVLTYGIAILFLLGLIVVFYQAFQGVTLPQTMTESFGNALWGTWGATIVIVSFVLFAGGAGILVLLGGGWRWE
jgi:hypothetical protein